MQGSIGRRLGNGVRQQQSRLLVVHDGPVLPHLQFAVPGPGHRRVDDPGLSPALRRYLREFLSDPRVVDLPRFLWLPLLNGVIIPFRAGKSAAAYREIGDRREAPGRSERFAQPGAVGQQFGRRPPAHGAAEAHVLPLGGLHAGDGVGRHAVGAGEYRGVVCVQAPAEQVQAVARKYLLDDQKTVAELVPQPIETVEMTSSVHHCPNPS